MVQSSEFDPSISIAHQFIGADKKLTVLQSYSCSEEHEHHVTHISFASAKATIFSLYILRLYYNTIFVIGDRAAIGTAHDIYIYIAYYYYSCYK